MLRFFRKKYVGWEDYKAKIDFLNTMNWQQSIRKSNMKVMKTFTL